MVQKISEVVLEYGKHLRGMPLILRSYGHAMLWEDGPNESFFTYLFCDQAIAIQFMKDMGLLRSKVQCNTCGGDMTWSTQPNIPKGFRW